MESLLPSSVNSLIRIPREKVKQSNENIWNTLTPSLIRTGSNTSCLDKVSAKNGRNFVSQLHGCLVGFGVRLSLMLKSIRAHFLAKG